jgi:transcriptional regulator with XRE-family HTH domain
MLANRARRAREKAGISVRVLGEKLGYPYSYVGRVERGEQLPSDALAEALDTYYGTDGLYKELLTVARAAEIPAWGRRVLEQEQRAARIQTFNSSVVPGLLQTEAYTSALYKESMPGKDAERLAFLVANRTHRRAVLERDAPPFYWAIMDEAALRRPVGGAEVMAEQIRRILDLIDNNSAVTVQVLPFSHGVHPLMGGSLSLLTLRDGANFGYVESFANGSSVDSPSEVLELTTLLDIARTKALDSGESRSLLHKYLMEYEG